MGVPDTLDRKTLVGNVVEGTYSDPSWAVHMVHHVHYAAEGRDCCRSQAADSGLKLEQSVLVDPLADSSRQPKLLETMAS